MPTTTAYYSWGVKQNGLLWGAAGLASLGPLLNMRRLNACWPNTRLFAAGLALDILFLLALVPWAAVGKGA